MENVVIKKTLVLIPLLLLVGCSSKYSLDEYVPAYNSLCKTEKAQGGIRFFAMPLSEDYEVAKWGMMLDSGMRVLLWAVPKSHVAFEQVFLESEGLKVDLVSMSKMRNFELDSPDMFVLVFPEKLKKSTLHVRGISDGIGNITLDLKDCSGIRLSRD